MPIRALWASRLQSTEHLRTRKYRTGSLIPAEPWLEVDCSGEPKNAFGPYGYVAVLRVPEPVMARFDGEELSHAAVRSAVIDWAKPLSDGGILHIHGFHHNAAGEVGVTKDESGQFLGLHIDSWEGPALSDRADRPNRLCINFGPGTRSFIYVPVSVTRMRNDGDQASVQDVIEHYCHSNADQLPVVAVEVPPGFAYVAPTELVVHDASTEHSREYCTTFTVRGFFALQRIFGPQPDIGQ